MIADPGERAWRRLLEEWFLDWPTRVMLQVAYLKHGYEHALYQARAIYAVREAQARGRA